MRSTEATRHSKLYVGLGQLHVAESVVVPIEGEKPNLLIHYLGGLIFILLGFLLTATGYRAASTGYTVVGIVLIAIGIALMMRKIVRRNQSKQS